jgi:uncharacterized membrane protein
LEEKLMDPEQLSRELREQRSEFLENRRAIVGLNMVAAGCMGLITLYQMGIIRHLPEPRLPLFDADKVDASAEAYQKLSTPDAVLGLGSYAATMVLASMGGKDRARDEPWLPILLAAKLAFDAAQAGRLSIHQWTRHRAFCIWCLIAAGATFLSVPFAVAETRAALESVRAMDRRRVQQRRTRQRGPRDRREKLVRELS